MLKMIESSVILKVHLIPNNQFSAVFTVLGLFFGNQHNMLSNACRALNVFHEPQEDDRSSFLL